MKLDVQVLFESNQQARSSKVNPRLSHFDPEKLKRHTSLSCVTSHIRLRSLNWGGIECLTGTKASLPGFWELFLCPDCSSHGFGSQLRRHRRPRHTRHPQQGPDMRRALISSLLPQHPLAEIPVEHPRHLDQLSTLLDLAARMSWMCEPCNRHSADGLLSDYYGL
jgi:hypothetical protein